jgi:TctA family transporter
MSNKLSLPQSLLIFYIFIASGFTKGIFNPQLTEYIEGNRLVQHIISYIFLLIIIDSYSDTDNTEQLIIYSLIGYIWFIFTTKLDVQINIIIIGMLLLGYIYENRMNKMEIRMGKDKIYSKDDTEKVKEKHRKMKRLFLIIVMGTTVFGTLLYGNKQVRQHGIQNGGGGFDMIKFLFY